MAVNSLSMGTGWYTGCEENAERSGPAHPAIPGEKRMRRERRITFIEDLSAVPNGDGSHEVHGGPEVACVRVGVQALRIRNDGSAGTGRQRRYGRAERH